VVVVELVPMYEERIGNMRAVVMRLGSDMGVVGKQVEIRPRCVAMGRRAHVMDVVSVIHESEMI
jgi:hypothetical protein